MHPVSPCFTGVEARSCNLMAQTSVIILCLAYITGLLSTVVSWGGYGILVLGIGAALLQLTARKYWLRLWKINPEPRIWVAAGLVGLIATLYLQVRTPQPAANDISKFVSSTNVKNQEQIVTVQGKIVSTPRLTQSQRGQFWIAAAYLDGNDVLANTNNRVTGKLYVTVPLLQVTGLHQGQMIAVTGVLYKPKPAGNPGAFDFQAYLAQEGGFAGFKGREVILLGTEQSPSWGWWAIRQRIIRSQVRWLGVPEGQLVSAMVLGNRVVDVPFSLSDSFVQVGLAHALAASGFQVSLILGVILALTRRVSSRVQFSFGIIALLIFLGLTGPQPSVLRAVFMGIGALIALVVQRKVKPLGLLLLAGTILLLFNPVWIWNLGFQFSFLATMGLLVTVPPLTKKLDWIPPAIATLIAVPIAAYLWTLPLQLYAFGLVSPYSIAVNIITTIPLSVISLGAFISAIAALILPVAGSALAWLLYYPTHLLIAIIEFFSQLPGATVAVGNISTLQLIALYGLIALVWLQGWWQKRFWFAGLIAIGLVLIPVWQTHATTFRATVLATAAEPVLVVQDRGKVLLVNSGDENTARFTVLPFLQQHGLNQIDWAIATNSRSSADNGWLQILQHLPIKHFYTNINKQANTIIENSVIQRAVQAHHGKYQLLNANQTVTVGSTAVQLIEARSPILQIQIQGKSWLLLNNLKPNEQKQLTLTRNLPNTEVLWWTGEALDTNLLKIIQPEVAIASSATLAPNTLSWLRKSKTQVFWTGRDGAIQWTPSSKFEANIESPGDKISLP